VAGQRERSTVHHLHRLEHAVADREAVVAHRHGRSQRIVEQLAVHPRAHVPDTRP
jgi:hypothetical protein